MALEEGVELVAVVRGQGVEEFVEGSLAEFGVLDFLREVEVGWEACWIVEAKFIKGLAVEVIAEVAGWLFV